ncbi:hypothetical protein F8568_012365 [Actinomadura sp. LD22]|uniref:Uncharacterized protein n=1 Tax=Actinomadura physcomitrii TaxID=2650748 RepID=A0A6I4MEW9_9ACTN|nr:hypothetical protein [Actinomadura physcomitrii]MWA01159.1 hypothetical protein [Actinomadura physcomitrii]
MAGEPKEVLRNGRVLLDAAHALIADHRRAVADVHGALAPLRAEAAREQLAEIPVARLKDVTDGRLRLTPLARTPDAVDVSEQALARRIVQEEQERLGTARREEDAAP